MIVLFYYEKGVIREEKDREYDEVCVVGIVRMFIRMGDIRRLEFCLR